MLELRKKTINILLLIPYIFFSGCGAKYYFESAKKCEKKGDYKTAIQKYRYVSSNFPKTIYAPAGLYYSARIYQENLRVYIEAKKLFSEIIEKYSENQYWVTLAKLGLMESPDYFPLGDDYTWVEGDSETLGKNMEAQRKCQLISDIIPPETTGDVSIKKGYLYSITKRYFTAGKMVTTITRYYIKEDYEVREMLNPQSKEYSVILIYPYQKMRTWKTKIDDRDFLLTILDDNFVVETKAGKFENCLKVRYEDVKLPGSYKYEYYAPGVGNILTTVGTEKSEHRNSELLSWTIKKRDE